MTATRRVLLSAVVLIAAFGFGFWITVPTCYSDYVGPACENGLGMGFSELRSGDSVLIALAGAFVATLVAVVVLGLARLVGRRLGGVGVERESEADG